MLQAHAILQLHDQATERWHREPAAGEPAASELALLVLAQHRANYDLWHQEDDARSPDASDHTIAEVKHHIDHINQRRNDLVEQIDNRLLHEAGPQNTAAPLHSETPGLIIDRLSILALKIYHTTLETHRASATADHRQANCARLEILNHQRDDLAGCLDLLWLEVGSGLRRFQLYRQLKMYNDPTLNPVLYRRG